MNTTAHPDPVAPMLVAKPLRSIASLPGPKGWPVVGNLPQIKPAEFHLQLERWAQEYGRNFQLRMGRIRLLVTADHEAVAAMMRDRPDGFRRIERLELVGIEMGLNRGLFGSNGEAWRRQRRMEMAAFDPGRRKVARPSICRQT